MHRAGLVCAAVILGIAGAPLAAQQTTANPQSPSYVPPAPPPDQQAKPDQQATPEAPPPFPPMPSAPPRHRWVDVGSHSSHASHAHHRRAGKHHGAKPSLGAHHRRAGKHSAKAVTKKQMRECRNLSHRQKLRHSSCVALARRQHEKATHEKSRRGKAKHRQKVMPHKPVHRHIPVRSNHHRRVHRPS